MQIKPVMLWLRDGEWLEKIAGGVMPLNMYAVRNAVAAVDRELKHSPLKDIGYQGPYHKDQSKKGAEVGTTRAQKRGVEKGRVEEKAPESEEPEDEEEAPRKKPRKS
jgi:hypothetical protein